MVSLNAKDVIFDSSTSLLWQDAQANTKLSIMYKEAQDYCENLVVGEYSDFRLPTLYELQTIIDYRNYKPAMIKGFNYSANETYWTSTPFADDKDFYWTISFKKGTRDVKANYYDRYVRCVQKLK